MSLSWTSKSCNNTQILRIQFVYGKVQNGKNSIFTLFKKCVLHPVVIYLFNLSYWNTIAICEICSALTIKTPERRHWSLFLNKVAGLRTLRYAVLVSLMLAVNIFCILFWCFHCWLWTSKSRLGHWCLYCWLWTGFAFLRFLKVASWKMLTNNSTCTYLIKVKVLVSEFVKQWKYYFHLNSNIIRR